MKYCIVNGDDFGASRGINRGIVEAYCHGVLTSTSLMVNMPASEEAAILSRGLPELSVGLHVNFTTEDGEPVIDLTAPDKCRTELHRQLERFQDLMGCLPTHLDSHHNIHRSPQLLPHFLDLAQQYRLPLREHSPVHYFPSFYGQWDGETHLEQISVESLVQMLEAEFREGLTELSCHPGYVEPDFLSTYAIEREAELQTLCSSIVKTKLVELQIQLIGFRELDDCLANLPG
ncbi:Cellobiose phosphotransferase system YdjC-like protein [uncultured Synechococcales cyanobacterium]|uniref:Cellobiose phosphotransferase system YdjC-like protein n=1 Tax=uncultured Synechococcales cyanobacterium TaxID=1936017 RepID=A0A6J4VKD2_9CYAN|nr:Cellobiose phosphotransferase system YdjC-like protein [uncultured Synechococcales cyanobacterium]